MASYTALKADLSRCKYMKPRNWVYVGEDIPGIDPIKNIEFLLCMQNAMLQSLVKRNLLTTSQMERIKENIERRAAKRKSE